MNDMLHTLLKEWDSDSEQLVFLGDYIDRGKESRKVLETVKYLKKEYGAILLRGNHEDMFLQWLENPEKLADFYLGQGGFETLKSFNISTQYHYERQASVFKDKYGQILETIKDMKYYHQDKKHIYVHAGINPNVNNLDDMNPIDLLWIRDTFFYKEHQIDKKVVFGHTPTRLINKNQANNVWISENRTKIGIDGGAVSGGNLIGLRIHGDKYEAINVNHALKVTNNKLIIK